MINFFMINCMMILLYSHMLHTKDGTFVLRVLGRFGLHLSYPCGSIEVVRKESNMNAHTESQTCYCDALEPGIICQVCETEFFGVEIEEIELDEVW